MSDRVLENLEKAVRVAEHQINRTLAHVEIGSEPARRLELARNVLLRELGEPFEELGGSRPPLEAFNECGIPEGWDPA